MKKIILLVVSVATMFCFAGCEQTMTRSFGGDMKIELKPNEKLEHITWKDDDSLWYLTKPMTENDTAETYLFQQSSLFGVWEGTVTIIETKENGLVYKGRLEDGGN